MRPAYQKPNWIVASISLGAFASITVILFAVMSGPFTEITDTIEEQSENMGVDSDVTPFLTMIATVFGIVFSFSMIGLVAWFFMGSQREETEEYTVGPRPPNIPVE